MVFKHKNASGTYKINFYYPSGGHLSVFLNSHCDRTLTPICFSNSQRQVQKHDGFPQVHKPLNTTEEKK